jgi:hypothetical protein
MRILAEEPGGANEIRNIPGDPSANIGPQDDKSKIPPIM